MNGRCGDRDGIGHGLLLGAAMGYLFGDPALGLALGVAIGVALTQYGPRSEDQDD